MPQLRVPRDKSDLRDLASWMCALSDAYVDGSALGFCHPILVQEEAVGKEYQSSSDRRILHLGKN